MVMKRISITFLLLLLLISCHKKEFKSYLGTYDCKQFTIVKEPGKPIIYTVDEGQTIEVRKDKKEVVLLNNRVHIDSISPGMQYFNKVGVVGDSLFINIFFENDSMFFQSTRKLGEIETTEGYFGMKIE